MVFLVACDVNTGVESQPIVVDAPANFIPQMVTGRTWVGEIIGYARRIFAKAKDKENTVVNVYDSTARPEPKPNGIPFVDLVASMSYSDGTITVNGETLVKPKRGHFSVQVVDLFVTFTPTRLGWILVLRKNGARQRANCWMHYADGRWQVTVPDGAPYTARIIVSIMPKACHFCSRQCKRKLCALFGSVTIDIPICFACISNSTRLLHLGIEMQDSS